MARYGVAFGVGVVSGVVMSYQFGTNWSRLSDRTGPVPGPLPGYEVQCAFFQKQVVGAAVLLPFTAGVYRVFRGRVRPGEGYH